MAINNLFWCKCKKCGKMHHNIRGDEICDECKYGGLKSTRKERKILLPL